MVKKTLLSLAVATALTSMVGCNVSSTDKYDNKITTDTPATQEMPKENGVAPVFDPANSQVPLGIDFLYKDTTDGTVNTADKTPPVTTAMNQLAGFSTVAPLYINVKGPMNPATLNADQEVFLIKLKNEVNGVPVDAVDLTKLLGAVGALTIDENDKVVGVHPDKFVDALAGLVPAADYSVDQVILDNNDSPLPSIRILLNKPLEARTKYLVVVTNKVQDATGKPLVPASHYELARGDAILPSAALDGVRSLVKLWDGLAKTALIGGGFLNPSNGDDIVLSYTFTTDDALDTLVSYAAPELFVQKNLSLDDAENLADKAQGQEPGTKIAARKATYDYLTAPAPQGAGLTLPAAPQGYFHDAVTTNLEGTRSNPIYIAGLYSTIAQTNLEDMFGVNASVRDLAFSPTAQDVKLVPSAVSDAVLADAQAQGAQVPANTSPQSLGVGASTDARFVQGYIELPKFLEPATKTTLVADKEAMKQNVVVALRADSRWQANTNVGAVLTQVKNDGNTYPPMDNDGVSTNVTYRYPFPQKLGTHKVPMLVAVPGAECAANAPYPVVMYVHGITGSRTNVLPMAGAMAGDGLCTVTIAIDLPEHGVAPQTKDSAGNLVANATMPFNMDVASGLWPQVIAGAAANNLLDKTDFEGITERHNGVYGSLARMSIDYEKGLGDSGSTFINLQNFGRTRDDLRQAVVDLLNVNASLKTIDAQLGGTEAAPKLDLTKVGVVGHSLGGMVASAFVAVNNQAAALNTNLTKIKTLTLANTGSHLTKLLENSPGFAPEIIGVPSSGAGADDGKGLEGNGVAQGSVGYESFLSIFQANIEAVDPVASLAKIDIPVTTITAPNDTTVPNNDYFSNEANPYLAGLKTQGKLPESWNASTAKAPLAGAAGLPVLNSNIPDTEIADSSHSSFANPEAAVQAGVGQAWSAIVTALNN